MEPTRTVSGQGLRILIQRASALASESYQLRLGRTAWTESRQFRTFVPPADFNQRAAELARDIPPGMFILGAPKEDKSICPVTSPEYWRAFEENEDHPPFMNNRTLTFASAEGELGKEVPLIFSGKDDWETQVRSASGEAGTLFDSTYLSWGREPFGQPQSARRNSVKLANGTIPEDIATLWQDPLIKGGSSYLSVSGVDPSALQATVSRYKAVLNTAPHILRDTQAVGLYWFLSLSLEK